MSSNQTKQNVNQFNSDVHDNQGYLYSTNAPYSARVANQRMSDAVLHAIPHHATRILDLGCGDGVYTAEIAAALPQSYVEGNDPAQEAIDVARQRHHNVVFNVGNILDLTTQPSEAFDVAVIRGVIHHLPDDSQTLAIQNARQLCRTLIIVEPNGNNPILKYIEKNSTYHIEHEEQSFDTQTLVNWCHAAGWHDVSVHYIGFVPFFFPELPSRIIHFFQPLLERIPAVNKYFSAQIVVVCRQ